MKKLLISFLFCFACVSVLAGTSTLTIPSQSRQLLIVTVAKQNSIHGTLQRYQRKSASHSWYLVGASIPVVVGKHGLARAATTGISKKENDSKTPIGVFEINSAFGFAPGYIKNIKLPYLQLAETTVCVSDPKSKFYNQIVDSKKIKQPDWNNAEAMRQIPQNLWGMSINYNDQEKAIPGAGSCVFIRLWKNPNRGTSGSVGMSEPNVEELITWLNPHDNPVVAIIPKNKHNNLLNHA